MPWWTLAVKNWKVIILVAVLSLVVVQQLRIQSMAAKVSVMEAEAAVDHANLVAAQTAIDRQNQAIEEVRAAAEEAVKQANRRFSAARKQSEQERERVDALGVDVDSYQKWWNRTQ